MKFRVYVVALKCVEMCPKALDLMYDNIIGIKWRRSLKAKRKAKRCRKRDRRWFNVQQTSGEVLMESQLCAGTRDAGTNDESSIPALDTTVNSPEVHVFCQSGEQRAIYRATASGLSQADHRL